MLIDGVGMKTIIINDNKLSIDNINNKTVRVKVFLVNNNNEVLLAYNNYTYQLLGGHVEPNESRNSTIVREIKEEAGIDINFSGEPFLEIKDYNKDYFSDIFYYRIVSNEMPNKEKTNYDFLESQTEFQLGYVPIDDLNKFLNENVKNSMIDVSIYKEMSLALTEYNKIYG